MTQIRCAAVSSTAARKACVLTLRPARSVREWGGTRSLGHARVYARSAPRGQFGPRLGRSLTPMHRSAFVAPDGRTLWVAVRGQDYVSVLDARTGGELQRIRTADG